MSERLRLLQRQQALLREHLAWIDTEILRESAPPLPAAPRPSAEPPADAGETADALIRRLADAERQDPKETRRGCLFVFAGCLLLLGGAVAFAWLRYYR